MLLTLVLCLYASAAAWAQNYPLKAVRFLVPFSAGSGSDTIARIVAGGLSQVLRQQVVVENRAGAAGNIGAEIAAKAMPDGYTVLLINMGHAANVSLYGKMPYDLVRDFAPVTQLAVSPSIVVVHPSLPVNSIGGLVMLAKARPGAINYASGGIGTATFIAAELFTRQAGIDLLHVPYRSGGEAITGVITGETPLYFAPLATALPHVRQGRLRALAVTTPKRLPLLPEYPTVAEGGYPGYETGNWYGLVVPAKSPKQTITTIHDAAVSALNDPGVKKRLSDLGYVIIGSQPGEFAETIKTEIVKLAGVLKQHNVTAR